jgi:hypothetical protein
MVHIEGASDPLRYWDLRWNLEASHDLSFRKWTPSLPTLTRMDTRLNGKAIYRPELHSSRRRLNQHSITLRDACLPSCNPGDEHGIGTWRDKVADVRWGHGQPAARR